VHEYPSAERYRVPILLAVMDRYFNMIMGTGAMLISVGHVI